MNYAKSVFSLTVALFGLSLLVAGATDDLRIDTERDEDRNTTYYLQNKGDRMIEAKVSMLKDCTGNRRKPTVRTFWVPPHDRVKLARVGAESSCRHEYRVQEAQYH